MESMASVRTHMEVAAGVRLASSTSHIIRGIVIARNTTVPANTACFIVTNERCEFAWTPFPLKLLGSWIWDLGFGIDGLFFAVMGRGREREG